MEKGSFEDQRPALSRSSFGICIDCSEISVRNQIRKSLHTFFFQDMEADALADEKVMSPFASSAVTLP